MSIPKKFSIGNLNIKVPIIQGGMGVGISLSGLASAVANQGGVGVIATAGIGMFEPDFNTNFLEANMRALRREIRRAREMTNGVLGINVMVALSNFADVVKTAIQEGIDIIFSGAGLPLNLPSYLMGSLKTKLVPIVSSARAANLISKRWLEKYDYLPDAVVVEGPKAGGHLGYTAEQIDDPNYALENVLPQIVAEVNRIGDANGKEIPVIAGGGVYTGADMRKIMDLGASGIQIATRLVTTEECDASDSFKETYLASKKEDIVIIKSPVGMPGRAISNSFIEKVGKGQCMPYKCPYHCIVTCDYQRSPYCIGLALMNAKKGQMEHGFAFAGSNAYRADKVTSVKEVMDSMLQEYEDSAKQ
ncbi:MAG TPA: nitronate monooxygenase family protein [Caldisericia bacterium]|nr:nitronate monooxygenase [Caldisericia bacterium]HOU08011.1 nitronate monooxygenase family protein [Caldisericia bacterium]HPL88943.1 nitronate monooxygenase family protein [Caldisericia bacterium]HQG59590.1 nitronate monooxygenase family protein [Caldisericia bacterium]HQH49213.1 nitronate monooxygenase family protein [Caldisericia bacterium]